MATNNINFDPRDFEVVKNIALQFPGAEESVSHEQTPSVKVNGKLLCRLHDNGLFIPIHIGFEHRDHFLETYPELFHLPAHFAKYPYMCMWTKGYTKKILTEVLEVAWRGLASKKMIQAYDEERNKPGK